MSQISVPWSMPDPEVRAGVRAKTIRRFLIGGILLVLMGLGMFALFGLNNAEQFSDWKLLAVALLFLGPFATGMALVTAAFAVRFYREIGRLLLWGYTAASIFFGGIIVICLVVWLHGYLFGLVQGLQANDQLAVKTTFWGQEIRYLSVEKIYEGVPGIRPLPFLAYLMWPLQSSLVRDVVAMGGIIGFISVIPLFGIWWERKVAGRIQSRLGPMRVGGWHGWAQSFADGIKLIFKEDLIPDEGDRILFRLAPYLAFVPAVCAFIALPFAGAWVFRDLDVALIFILAMLGIEVVGVIVAGWASNNKWSVYGAMREACQMVSYEIPMGMALLIPVMMAGSLQLTEISNQQGGGFHTWFAWKNPWCFAAFFAYYTASLASCKRAPFDLPESESELVAGFHTEYSGFRWSLFFFAEYAAMFVVSGLAVILFLGGWKSPFPPSWADAIGDSFPAVIVKGLFLKEGPIIFVLKCAFLYYVQLWVRWTLPRIRIDQVLYGCIQVLLPLMMGLLLANTLWLLGLQHYGWLRGIDSALHWVLVIVGAAMVVAVFFIAAKGYLNRRRLVGTLVIEHLPGS